MFSYIHTEVSGATSREIQMSIYELNFEVWCLTTLPTAVFIQRLSQINEKGWSNDGMILTGENRSTQRKACLLPLRSP